MLKRLSGILALLPFLLFADSFDSAVLPIFKAKCLGCHNDKGPQGKLSLSSLEAILKGGTHGPAITPANSSKSLLVDKLIAREMPPGKEKLSDPEIELIRAWIDKDTKPSETLTEHEILPIFQVRCIACHGKRKQEGGLDLRTIASRLKGGKSGPGFVPGKPEESLIIKRIVAGEMPPPKLQLEFAVRTPTDSDVAKLKKWIADGAPAGDPRATADFTGKDPLVKDSDRKFWAFQPPQRPAPPAVKNAALVRNSIDAFLLEKLEAKNLKYSPEAGKLRLMRRAYIDLTGMPPTPAEIQAYGKDTRADAYERLVDRLLESEHYGERWGRYWLDLAGYSDSEGFGQDDGVRRFAWRYRDYVIRSLNADKPYSTFLTEQIAGDELGPVSAKKDSLTPVSREELDRLAATGFLRTTPDPTNAPERGFIQERMNIIADETEVLSSAVMGLTVGCARCHNHKYDPIPQRDYYRLTAILQASYDPYDWDPPKRRELAVADAAEIAEYEKHNKPYDGDVKRLEAQLEVLKKTEGEKQPEADRKKMQVLQKELNDLRGKMKPKPHVRVLMDNGSEPSTFFLLRRGDPMNPGELVTPGPPSVLASGINPYKIETPYPGATSSGRRLALARWLTQPNHPLTARVAMNQMWMRHFGRGIVASTSNFGKSGAPPTHPELLDWLATEFVAKGWSLKAMHRLMMTSTAYRQASTLEAPSSADPENALLSRMPLRRMDAESLYDSVVRATGRLDRAMYGSAADIEVKADKEVVVKPAKTGYRRAIYVLHRRQTPVTMFEVFDQPPMTPNCTERRQSNVSTQALQMLNGTMTWDMARYMAGRLLDENQGHEIEQAYLRTLTRKPTASESAQAEEAWNQFTVIWKQRLAADNIETPIAATARWEALASLCHTLINSAEFAFID